MKAGESRSFTMGLEETHALPPGLLQAVNEQLSGYREQNSLLPAHVNRDPDRRAEHIQMAARMQEKMGEFDNIVPLAVDAYMRGDKATRQSLESGSFPQEAVDNTYTVLSRMPKYGGDDWTVGDARKSLAGVMGNPSKDLTGAAQAPAPRPINDLKIWKRPDGRYMTGDTFLDTMLSIESGGRLHDKNGNILKAAGSSARGLFQVIDSTARSYGLLGDGFDLRGDPEASLAFAVKYAQDNAKSLKKNGIPVSPLTVYLSHQQGAGGIKEIWDAANGRGTVSKGVRANMDNNGGRGLTPAQFLKKYDNIIAARMEEARANGAKDGFLMGADVNIPNAPSYAQAATPDGTQPAGGQVAGGQVAVDTSWQKLMTATAPASAPLQESDTAEGEDDGVSEKDKLATTSVNWAARLDDLFRDGPVTTVPSDLHEIILQKVRQA